MRYVLGRSHSPLSSRSSRFSARLTDRHRRHRGLLAVGAGAALVLTACSSEASPGGSGGADDAAVEGALNVYATTGYLADAVSVIAPDAEVTTMVGPGGDPHTYQPSTQDIQTLQNADLVLWNGLHLEAQMEGQLRSLGDAQVAVGEEIDAELLLPWPDADEEGEPMRDPHIWNSPEAWSQAVEVIAETFSEHDPERADDYQQRAEGYLSEIQAAADEAADATASIPAPRILVTGHDAFNYYGDTYDLEVHATDFISSDAALSAGELSELADLIAEHEVPVIFYDNQASPQAITSLREAVQSRGWDVAVSEEELFADSLGAGDNVNTYLKVFRHNTEAIVNALGDEHSAD
ncbi:metal ABC transporter substrate-binding protein [Citricoccus muralis]|uniref:Zinc ABC transporter substrate-binding protein n=1 Tax=Citricoccus muralis TaxID=169134 RepID=A0ABY8H8F2_9MICC|nr:zinc ABC transporter substrate-binding protein [Citricoccus muralis]WFP17438.1 zinc ABC transporter substrate-binding protein [Citricoccus muralis]